jgi:hypothetical protein
MEPRSIKGLFVGYDDHMSKAYHVYNPHTCWIVISKNIMFNEEFMGKVALNKNKLLGLYFLTTIPIALEDVDDKSSTNEKFETKEIATPIVKTWKS